MRSYTVLTVIIKQTAHRINRIQICRPNDTVTRIRVRAEHTEGTNDREEGEGFQREGKTGGRLGREEGWWGGRWGWRRQERSRWSGVVWGSGGGGGGGGIDQRKKRLEQGRTWLIYLVFRDDRCLYARTAEESYRTAALCRQTCSSSLPLSILCTCVQLPYFCLCLSCVRVYNSPTSLPLSILCTCVQLPYFCLCLSCVRVYNSPISAFVYTLHVCTTPLFLPLSILCTCVQLPYFCLCLSCVRVPHRCFFCLCLSCVQFPYFCLCL